MTKPRDWGQGAVDRALAGDTDSLYDAFTWSNTTQGFLFWASEAHSRELSPEAREILVNWSNEK